MRFKRSKSQKKESNLSLIQSTSKVLESINHPDSLRIAKEIVSFYENNRKKIEKTLKKIKNNTPWEHIKKESQFRTVILEVNKHTLIPRIETEKIVDMVIEILSEKKVENIVDVGTGSGAIIISIASEVGDRYQYCGLDISKTALKVAKRNAQKNNVSIDFRDSDLLNSYQFDAPTVVIANLPYIPTEHYLELDKSVKDFEPRGALDGGIDGTYYIERLLSQVKFNSRYVEAIVLEIDPLIEKGVKVLIEKYLPDYTFEFLKDYREQIRYVAIKS